MSYIETENETIDPKAQISIRKKRMGKTLRKIVTRAVKSRITGSKRPFLLAHFVTSHCMCKCPSCLWKNNDWDEVPLDVLKKFYSEAKQEGFLATGISGGEPFLRKDLGELVRFIKEEANMSVLLINTGWFLKKRMDEVLPYVDVLVVSLDSSKPERHDQIRGIPNLYNTLMEALTIAKEKYPDITYKFNCCIQKGIGEEIYDLIELTKKMNMMISFDVITEYRNGEAGSSFTSTEMGLSHAERQEICKYLLKKKLEGAPIFNSQSYFRYFAEEPKGYKCHFPKFTMAVDGRGNIEDCLNLNQPIANIRETPLKEIMELPRFKELRVDAEACCSCNSPTMVDISHVWQNPLMLFQKGGIQFR